MRAARTGDGASLGILLERHRAGLYALALSMLGHGPDAEEAVHEAFLVALRRFDELRASIARDRVSDITRAELALIEGSGHLPFVEAQERFLEVIAEFLGLGSSA